MTFTELRTAVCDYCNLTSPEALTRVGNAINRHYRRVTSSLGLDAARFITRSASTTNGVRTVVFAEIEKIDRLLDTTAATSIRLLQEVSVHKLRSSQPGAGQPVEWAFQNSDADSVTILLDTVPQTVYSLQADGWTTLADLSGSGEPVFPESYHDILVWFVISEELLKKEKDKLAGAYQAKATNLLSELRFFLADSHTKSTKQRSDNAVTAASGAGGGGAGNTGGTAYTQTALLTFDRGAGLVPFAVAEADAPYVVNLGAEFLGNIATDRLIGRDTAGTGETEQLTVGNGLEFTGSGGIGIVNLGVTTARINDLAVTTGKIADVNVTAAKIADNAITYAKMQALASASRLLGRGSSGTGVPQELTVANGLSIAGTVLSSKIVQIITSTVATEANSSSATYADTGLTATITPTSASNKVLIFVCQAGLRKTGNTQIGLRLNNPAGGTALVQLETQAAFTNTAGEFNVGSSCCVYLDSPASTSALTYKTQFNSGAGVATASVNYPTGVVSSMMLVEVTP